MKNRITIAALAMTGLFFASCEKENELNELNDVNVNSSVNSPQMSNQSLQVQDLKLQVEGLKELPEVGENTRDLFANAVEASKCGPTEFVAVQNYYFDQLWNDLNSVFDQESSIFLYNRYMLMNNYIAYFDAGEQYFGAEGEYTNLMIKRQRELEKFWNMPNEIRINGQHTASLNDREKLADLWEIIGANVSTREDAYAIADNYLFYNSLVSTLPDNPFFALDGFATRGDLIVIGDGIVQMLTDAGIKDDIVWTGILSHEWAHQVQFNNYGEWYPSGAADSDPTAATRYTELEADFFAAYFMTHKRGATYNWKRVESFYNLFFNIGDCGFDRDGHHGTPYQRLAASQLGYELANSAQKQGHIMSPDELHVYFTENIDSLL